jgi:tRNA threonylcarbamoyladenosine modification (KEOPS) complex  Pcc1 subunit
MASPTLIATWIKGTDLSNLRGSINSITLLITITANLSDGNTPIK